MLSHILLNYCRLKLFFRHCTLCLNRVVKLLDKMRSVYEEVVVIYKLCPRQKEMVVVWPKGLGEDTVVGPTASI